MMQQMPHSSTGAVALGHLATLQRLKSLCVSGWNPKMGTRVKSQEEKCGKTSVDTEETNERIGY